jgi:TOD1/MUCI70, glycosyltransferase-like domain
MSECVYTVLTGGYEDLLEQPIATSSQIDFICFTDDRTLQSRSWQIRHIDPVFRSDPGRSSRHPKILAQRFLADYGVSLYIDNAVRLTRTPESVFGDLLGDDTGFAAMPHSFRATLDDEFDAVIAAGYDSAEVCEEQRAHYRRRHPDLLAFRPIVGGLLLRRHNRPDVAAAMERWWSHVVRYSRRDQLSLPVALAESGLAVSIIDLDVRNNDYFQWPVPTNRRRGAGAEVATIRDGCRRDPSPPPPSRGAPGGDPVFGGERPAHPRRRDPGLLQP